jgi:ferrochelatase
MEDTLNTPNRLAVVLFQLGGPDSLDAVEPFLFNLFSDPDIIEFPFARLARPLLARLVASRRARKVREHYAQIGGKSPIGELTARQAAALESELRRRIDARVFVAMRYWHPLTEEALQAIASGAFEGLVLLPLYPQYSRTTTGSSLNEWRRRETCLSKQLPTAVIREFYDHPLYIEAVVERINEGLEKFGGLDGSRQSVHLVFSAHGLPINVVEAGDPYPAQVEATVRLVMKRGGWPNPHVLCYQSRVSPGRWLQPSLDSTLTQMAAEEVRNALIIPVSFVTDHVETLNEINIEARAHAQRAGIKHFELMPALNDSPTFIRALADLVVHAANSLPGDQCHDGSVNLSV